MSTKSDSSGTSSPPSPAPTPPHLCPCPLMLVPVVSPASPPRPRKSFPPSPCRRCLAVSALLCASSAASFLSPSPCSLPFRFLPCPPPSPSSASLLSTVSPSLVLLHVCLSRASAAPLPAGRPRMPALAHRPPNPYLVPVATVRKNDALPTCHPQRIRPAPLGTD